MTTHDRAGVVLILAVAAIAALATFGTWPHAYVDFGRELYVPWRLAEGDWLYRDIHYFNGPLSPYWNAGWLALAGRGLRGLLLLNLAIATGIAVALYGLLRRIAGPIGATAGVVTFAGAFAFTQLDPIGNDNYLTPYSHEVTHGLALSLAALWCAIALPRRPLGLGFTSGVLAGLAFLTKAEIFVALAAGLAVAFVLAWRAGHWPLRPAITAGVAIAAGTLLPPLIAFSLLSSEIGAAAALAGTLGSWPHVVLGDVSAQPFYRATLGTLDLGGNLLQMIYWSIAIGGLGALLWRLGGTSVEAKPGRSGWRAVAIAMATLAGCGALTWAHPATFVEVTRPLPLLLAALLFFDLRALVGSPSTSDPIDVDRRVTRIVFATFALVLLAKIGLRVRIDQYGFALAMPGATLAAAIWVDALPRAAAARGADPRFVRAGALGALVGVLASLFLIALHHAEQRSARLGSGVDAFLAPPLYADPMNALLDEIEARAEPGATLAVLPEGVMINYLARRTNPTGHINFMPPEFAMFGANEIQSAFIAQPPDYVAIVHKDTREYGVGFFGKGYGGELSSWLRAHYQPVARWGQPPLQRGTRFGILLLERND